jgi:hypothetical protein
VGHWLPSKQLRRRFAAALAVTIAAGAGAGAAPSLAAGTSANWRGFNENVVLGGAMSASQLATWDTRANANVDRYTLNWSGVYPGSATQTPNWTTYDQIYQALISAGIRPVIVVASAPSWAITPGGSNPCPSGQECAPTPDHYADYVKFVTQVAQRYPQAAAIEIWNEENDAVNWGTYSDPSDYANLLAQSYTAIKAVEPGMTVLMGSLAERPFDQYGLTGQVTGMIDSEFLADVYSYWNANDGGHVYMDGIGVHPYPSNMSDAPAFQMLDRVRDVRDAYGNSSMPLYITETGLSPTLAGVTENQAARMDGQLATALAAPDVKGILFHTLVDVWGGVGQGYGMLSSTGGGNYTALPSFCELAQVNGSSYSCPLPTDDPVQDARWTAQQDVHNAYEIARSWWEAHGTFTTLTNQVLNAANPIFSALAPASITPGPTANPGSIVIWQYGSQVSLCNASTADHVYCIYRTGSTANGATNQIGAPVTYALGPTYTSAVDTALALAGTPGGWAN